MFLKETLTALTKGMKQTFDADYPEEDFRNLHVSIEYPAEEQNYPGIWVSFEPQGDLSIAGIEHREFEVIQVGSETRFGEATRWRFEGRALFTLVSLTSLARARLLDEVVRVIGMGHLEEGRGAFRTWVNENPLIAMNLMTDHIGINGLAETQGTPWGTDDILYEVTLSLNAIGEFTSTPNGTLVPLSAINVFPGVEGQGDPRPGEGWA